MIVELFVFFQIIVLVLFFIAFYTKQEIVWALTAVFAGFMMFSSFDVQTFVYEFNSTISAYSPVLITNHYLYLVWINGIFFGLSVILGLFDVFDKYGVRLLKRGDDEENE
jgi:hypothetical protein